MKPILLHGHERAITQIKYSREGDLIFTAAKDNQPNVWYSLNGERLGSFKGHNGAVWCIDVNWDTTKVLTGSADNSCKIWDCETGKNLHTLDVKNAVRSCGFSYSGNLIMYSTDKTMGHPCEIHIFDIRDPAQIRDTFDSRSSSFLNPHIMENDITVVQNICNKSNEPTTVIPITGPKITSAIWGPYEEYIIAGHENGDICQYETKSGKKLYVVQEHSKQINDLQLSLDMSMLISASKDTTAKLFDTASLRYMKTYKTERPVNSAALSPLQEHVVLGGGQEAMEVTTTSTRVGKFDARFYHLIFEEEFGRVKGHFGPINSLAFHPDGKSYSSGGEDGYVRVHYFDPEYFDFRFEF